MLITSRQKTKLRLWIIPMNRTILKFLLGASLENTLKNLLGGNNGLLFTLSGLQLFVQQLLRIYSWSFLLQIPTCEKIKSGNVTPFIGKVIFFKTVKMQFFLLNQLCYNRVVPRKETSQMPLIYNQPSSLSTVKLGYNKHTWDRPNLFVITGICYNRVG